MIKNMYNIYKVHPILAHSVFDRNIRWSNNGAMKILDYKVTYLKNSKNTHEDKVVVSLLYGNVFIDLTRCDWYFYPNDLAMKAITEEWMNMESIIKIDVIPTLEEFVTIGLFKKIDESSKKETKTYLHNIKVTPHAYSKFIENENHIIRQFPIKLMPTYGIKPYAIIYLTENHELHIDFNNLEGYLKIKNKDVAYPAKDLKKSLKILCDVGMFTMTTEEI